MGINLRGIAGASRYRNGPVGMRGLPFEPSQLIPETRMHVEWTTYGSPVGALTVVECEAGPLVVEFPHRALTVKWAVRLRSAIPELHIAQGPCRATTRLAR